jgi:hypothetical protein
MLETIGLLLRIARLKPMKRAARFAAGVKKQ